MKRLCSFFVIVLAMSSMLHGCGSGNTISNSESPDAHAPKNGITEEMAYEGVYNYCRETYDWSVAEDNPSLMYVVMGEETESEYQVVFRSYTGAFVYFYVDKSSGTARLTEYLPSLAIEEEAGTIDLRDYLDQDSHTAGNVICSKRAY